MTLQTVTGLVLMLTGPAVHSGLHIISSEPAAAGLCSVIRGAGDAVDVLIRPIRPVKAPVHEHFLTQLQLMPEILSADWLDKPVTRTGVDEMDTRD